MPSTKDFGVEGLFDGIKSFFARNADKETAEGKPRTCCGGWKEEDRREVLIYIGSELYQGVNPEKTFSEAYATIKIEINRLNDSIKIHEDVLRSIKKKRDFLSKLLKVKK